MAEYQRRLRRDPSLFSATWSHAEPWLIGAEGEMFVARVLEALPRDWYITHDISLGSNGANLDHVVVGPPGAFVINTKNHGEGPVVVDGDVFTERRAWPHVAQGDRESLRCTEALTAACGRPIFVAAVIAIVALEVVMARQPRTGRTRVVPATGLVPFLTGWPAQLGPCDAEHLTSTVRSPATWERSGPKGP